MTFLLLFTYPFEIILDYTDTPKIAQADFHPCRITGERTSRFWTFIPQKNIFGARTGLFDYYVSNKRLRDHFPEFWRYGFIH